MEIAGTNFISTAAAIVLTSAITKGDVYTTGVLSAIGGLTFGNETDTGGALGHMPVSEIKSTSTSQNTYTITAPAVGVMKFIFCSAVTTSGGPAVVLTTGTWDGTNKNVMFTSGASLPYIMAIGVSTSRWAIIEKSATTLLELTNT